MVTRALTRKLLRDVVSLRGQLIAIIILVGAGSATFMMMRSMHSSLLTNLTAYYQQYHYPDLFVAVKRAPNTVADRLRSIPGIQHVNIRMRHHVAVDIPGLDEVASADLISVPRASSDLVQLHYVVGRAPEKGDVHEAVLYAPFAEANNLSVGDSLAILLNGSITSIRVVGTAISPEYLIIVSPGSLMLDNKRNGVIWMDEQALASTFDMKGAWNSALIQLSPNARLWAVIPSVDQSVAAYGSWGVTERNDQQSHRFIVDEIRQNEVSALIIPSIIYGVAVFLLNVSLSRLVSTQQSIIAVLRAFGYTGATLAWHYVAIAVIVVFLGTLFGILVAYVLGIRLAAWYMEFYRFPSLEFHITTGIVLATFGMGLISAIAGAVGAVRTTLSMQPAEAMKPPSPKTYLPGIGAYIARSWTWSTKLRLIMQNIDRRRWQSVVVVFMIGLSTAILVMARFMNDTFDYMIALEFDRGLLADATLTFARPVATTAQAEITSIPGVRSVELFRMVPVDVYGRKGRYRTVIASRTDGSSITRVVDDHGAIYPIPKNGLMITRYLANYLAIQRGDTVTLVTMENRRDTLRMEVSSVVNESLGAQCYVAPPVMNSILNEQGAANGAFLRVDNGAMGFVQREMKSRPVVVGMMERTVALSSFRDVYGDNVLVVAAYLLFLACAVSAGVLYNSARVMVAERSTELATLRIQGFTVLEVVSLVVGELGLLMLLGLPIGAALGTGTCYVIASNIEADFFRIPFTISMATFVISSSIIISVMTVVSIRIYLLVKQLDLVVVLKERI